MTRNRTLSLLFSTLLLGLLAHAGIAQEPGLNTREEGHPQIKRDSGGNLVFKSERLAAMLVKGEHGFGPLILYPATRATQPPSRRVATVPVLAQVAWSEGGATHTGVFQPSIAEIFDQGQAVRLRGDVRDGGASWSIEAVLRIGRDPWISWEVRARPSASIGLTRFSPMPLSVGHDGGREALFPGVAFLETGEAPAAGALVPSPYRVTVPAMSFSQDETTVALLWDNRRDWGGRGYPAALFQVPETGERRMELSLPPPPAQGGEGDPAAQSVQIAGGRELALSGKIVILREQGDPAEAIRQWDAAYGGETTDVFGQLVSNSPRYPRDFEQERRLSREPYIRAAEGGGTAGPFGALALLIESGLASDSRLRERLRSDAARAIEELGKSGPLEPRLAYRTGGVLASVERTRTATLPLIDLQLANGGWPLPPSAQGAVPRGAPAPYPTGNTLLTGGASLGPGRLGWVTRNALPILRYAVLTGDSDAVGAGLRALALIDPHPYGHPYGRFRVPRGGTAVSPEAPDLQVAAEAMECFLLGYQMNGERRYVESARYWANAGLAFVYQWGEGAKPAMRGASLATMSGAPGVPAGAEGVTQRAGLYFARVVDALTEVRPDDLYLRVERSILASAEYQQFTTGDNAGRYPEHWSLAENRPDGAALDPEELLAALYRFHRIDTEVAHVRLRVGPDRVFVASGATVKRADTSATRLTLSFRWANGDDTFLTVSGVPTEPISVQYNTCELRRLGIPVPRSFLPETDKETQRGWYYDRADGVLILRLPHTGGDDHLEIRWPDPKDRTPIDRVDARIRPRH